MSLESQWMNRVQSVSRSQYHICMCPSRDLPMQEHLETVLTSAYFCTGREPSLGSRIKR